MQSQTASSQVQGVRANAEIVGVELVLSWNGSGVLDRWDESGAVPQVRHRRRIRFFKAGWEGALIVQF